MKSFLNTVKNMDGMGRKPPSRHYQIDQNSQKIYSSLYPEPGIRKEGLKVTFKQDSQENKEDRIEENPYYKQML